MSIWLTEANRVANTARGHATAQGRKQAAKGAATAASMIMDIWLGAAAPKTPAKARKRS
ncbi:MAG: hypothetical protein ABI564_06240 [Ideonella sp.]